MTKHYWGYRINTNEHVYFRTELENGRLRQGWGWDNKQDLRNMQMDSGAKRNLPIFNKVKKGDILLVPRLPSWNEVAIVEATEDFSKGYYFEISSGQKDYGHVFPAKLLRQFVRANENISGKIRATIKNVSRFWNIDRCGSDIEMLMGLNDHELRDRQSYTNRFSNAIDDSFNDAFDYSVFSENIYNKLIDGFSNEEWEYALVEGLKRIFPEPFKVIRTGGISETNHGTDILIKIPGLLNDEYGIAIQVKDYKGFVNDKPLAQLSKADTHWTKENIRIIDKILIITKAAKEDNVSLDENINGIRVIFADELQELLSSIGLAYKGISNV